VSANPILTNYSARRQGAGFFRWEQADEPASVHFHLNTVELLERDAIRAGKKGAAGILLGKRDETRELTFIVENYEPVPVATWKTTDSPFGDARQLKAMIDRWQSRPDKRMSVLGFYRSSAEGEKTLTEDDLSLLQNPDQPESIFLLIEPRSGKASNGRLFLTKDNAVSFEWDPAPFNRAQLSGRGFPRSSEPSQPATARRPEPVRSEPQRPEPQRPEPQRQEPQRQEPQRRELQIPKESHEAQEAFEAQEAEEAGVETSGGEFRLSREWQWGLGATLVLLLLAAGFYQLRGWRSADTPNVKTESSTDANVGLKLDQAGADWRLSWNPDAPAVLRAAKGQLLITDGGIQKTIDLDASDLRGGSVVYSPLSKDVVFRLQLSADDSSVPTLSETVRVVGQLPAGMSAAVAPAVDSPAPAVPPASVTPTKQPALSDKELQDIIKRASNRGDASSNRSSTVLGDTEKYEVAGHFPAKAPPPRTSPRVKLPEDTLTVSRTLPPSAPHSKAHQASSTGLSTIAANGRGPAVASKPAGPVMPGDPMRAPAELIPVIPASSASSSGSAAAAFAPSVTRYARRGGAVQPALLLTNINPVYPAEAKEAGISGPVEVRFKISVMGDVHDVVVVKGPEILGQAAVDAVRERRYKPARVDGVPTETDASAIFEFKLN